ncbi:EpsG family protein [Bacteroides sp. 519]|uniref:EpsG family protein n=1 Tax=Bacteroides sp. 519 TaxID=2302937 RepID=UPI0013D4D9E6|nr:EpsG family protein [Bacteroides sp. 519]NDV60216.1 EpsG family protein [Bacteroides sp. 519]
MLDFIPLSIYTDLFNFLIFGLIVVALYDSFSGQLFEPAVRNINNVVGPIILIVVILYMGLRPVSFEFGDTINYAHSFFRLQMSGVSFRIADNSEWVFNTIMLWFAKYGNIHSFFLFCATIYVGALWWAFKRIFNKDFLIPLIVAMAMFEFWSYGTNGIRNGMAASIIILALTYRSNLIVMVLLSVIGLGIHNSMSLMLAAAAVAFFVKDSKWYFYFWVACIPLSLIGGNTITNLIIDNNLIGDDRFEQYLTSTDNLNEFSKTGFRWDFLLYSALPVVVGYYFIFKKKYTDVFYIWLYNIYLLCNAFWIIVIRASFSNRFAQISWFIIPLVLIYPFFMKKFWPNQQTKIGYVVIISYLYTFYRVLVAL